MSVLDLNALNALPKVERILALAETNAQLEKLDAEGRVAWALENLPGNYVLSSSFGIQAAVSLHLVNQIRPDIPVILTDTGYLFPETYQFIDELTDKLKLNLKVYRAAESAAWQEARYGKLWEQGVEGIEKYNEINKVEPMNRALKELNAQTWFAGLRREQSGSRATLPVLAVQRGAKPCAARKPFRWRCRSAASPSTAVSTLTSLSPACWSTKHASPNSFSTTCTAFRRSPGPAARRSPRCGVLSWRCSGTWAMAWIFSTAPGAASR